jgi:Bacterial Ig-like domain
MRKHSNNAIWHTTLFLLLLIANGCSDPDKNGGGRGLTPPTVLSVAPTGARDACTNTIVTATFSEAMNPSTINASTFTLTDPNSAPVSGTVTYNSANNTATFAPSSALARSSYGVARSSTYTATITAAAKDMFGNALATNDVWTFATGISACQAVGAPTVLSVIPANGACPNTAVTATFGEAMNASTINTNTFTVSNATGTVSYDALDLTATFSPSLVFALNTTYPATITTGAQDVFGNGLAANFTWTFTTAALACQASVPLNSAASFEILAGSTVANTGPTVITGGDLGLSPGSAVTGFPPGVLTLPAVMRVTDPIAAQAELDLTTAYNYAAGVQGAAVLPSDMSGLTRYSHHLLDYRVAMLIVGTALAN